jgi:hypothetical protein
VAPFAPTQNQIDELKEAIQKEKNEIDKLKQVLLFNSLEMIYKM